MALRVSPLAQALMGLQGSNFNQQSVQVGPTYWNLDNLANPSIPQQFQLDPATARHDLGLDNWQQRWQVMPPITRKPQNHQSLLKSILGLF